MLLFFAQKSWTGLFLHNLLHTNSNAGDAAPKQDAKEIGFSYSCTCVDDFLMPVDNVVAEIVFQPVVTPFIETGFTEQSLPYITLPLSFLRGPPVATV